MPVFVRGGPRRVGPRRVVAPVIAAPRVVVAAPRRVIGRRRCVRRAIVVRPYRRPWVPFMATYFLIARAIKKEKVRHEAELQLAQNTKLEEVVVQADNAGDLVVASGPVPVCDASRHNIVDLTELYEVSVTESINGQTIQRTMYADRKCAICGQHFFAQDSSAADMTASAPNPYPSTTTPAPAPVQYQQQSEMPPPSYQQPVAAVGGRFCTNCGSKGAGGNFCGNCGNKLN